MRSKTYEICSSCMTDELREIARGWWSGKSTCHRCGAEKDRTGDLVSARAYDLFAQLEAARELLRPMVAAAREVEP